MQVAAGRTGSIDKSGRPLAAKIAVTRFPNRYFGRLRTNQLQIGFLEHLVALQLVVNFIRHHLTP